MFYLVWVHDSRGVGLVTYREKEKNDGESIAVCDFLFLIFYPFESHYFWNFNICLPVDTLVRVLVNLQF